MQGGFHRYDARCRAIAVHIDVEDEKVEAGDVEIGTRFEKSADAGPDEAVVVCDGDSCHVIR